MLLARSSCAGWTGRMDSLRLHSTDTALPCPHWALGPKPSWPAAELAQCENNTSKQTSMMFFLLCIKDIPASQGPLKLSQDLFCPLLSPHAWKIPSKTYHKTFGYFPCILQESWNVKFLRIWCSFQSCKESCHSSFSRAMVAIIISNCFDSSLRLAQVRKVESNSCVGNAKWALNILQLLLTEREGCPENYPVMS